MNYYTLHFDASVRPTNPGGYGSYGFTIQEYMTKIKEISGEIGQWPDLTNNFAEFFALYKGLDCLTQIIKNPAHIEVRGDSKLIISIMNDRWKAHKSKEYYKAVQHCKTLVKTLRDMGATISFSWILRSKNSRADALSKKFEITLDK